MGDPPKVTRSEYRYRKGEPITPPNQIPSNLPPTNDSVFADVPDDPKGGMLFASATSLRRLMSCPFQFYAFDILKYREPSNANLFFGTVFDETLNYNYGEKITSGKDLPKSTLQDYFRAQFDAGKDKVELWKDEQPDALKETGTSGVDVFREEVTDMVHPVKVQPKLSMTFSNANVILNGRPDVLDKSTVIVDNKTSAKTQPDTYIKQALQPPIYSILSKEEAQKDQEVRFDILVKTKKPKVQQLKVTITDQHRQATLKVIANQLDLLSAMKERQNFPPSAFYRGGWECGYCAVAGLCRKTWGLDIPESKLTTQASAPLAKKDHDEALGQFEEQIKQGKVQEALAGLEKTVKKKGVHDPEEDAKRSILI